MLLALEVSSSIPSETPKLAAVTEIHSLIKDNGSICMLKIRRVLKSLVESGPLMLRSPSHIRGLKLSLNIIWLAMVGRDHTFQWHSI